MPRRHGWCGPIEQPWPTHVAVVVGYGDVLASKNSVSINTSDEIGTVWTCFRWTIYMSTMYTKTTALFSALYTKLKQCTVKTNL